MRKLYLDMTAIKGGCVGVMVSGAQVIPAGATVNAMPVRDKNAEYQRYAQEYDIHFIFDDDIPTVAFYTVPQVDIVARDSAGGFIGAIGQHFDLESDTPVCYINNLWECFLIAETAKAFLRVAPFWKQQLRPYDRVVFYSSRAKAEETLEFVRLPEPPKA